MEPSQLRKYLPVLMLGLLAGSTSGARILMRAQPIMLRRVFAGAVAATAAQMIYSGFTGRL